MGKGVWSVPTFLCEKLTTIVAVMLGHVKEFYVLIKAARNILFSIQGSTIVFYTNVRVLNSKINFLGIKPLP